MRIGVISDTHGVAPAWVKALYAIGGADMILHAGDVLYHPPRLGATPGYDIPDMARLMNECPVPITVARGNCDAEVYEELLEIPVQSPYAVVQAGGLRIVINHGHTLSADDLARLVRKYHADVMITGHTHIPVLDRIGDAIHMNPGSPSHPKFELDGRLTPTVGMVTDGQAQILEVESGDIVMSTRIR